MIHESDEVGLLELLDRPVPEGRFIVKEGVRTTGECLKCKLAGLPEAGVYKDGDYVFVTDFAKVFTGRKAATTIPEKLLRAMLSPY